MSVICCSFRCVLFVKLLIIFSMMTNLRGFDLNETTENLICKVVNARNTSNSSCNIFQEGGILNYTQVVQQTLLCRSDNILSFKLESSLEERLMYVVEKRKRNSSWEYANKGLFTGSTIFSINRLEDNTFYTIRTWIVTRNIVFTPIQTESLKTLANDVKPLPVKALKSDYFFTEKGSYAVVQWIPADDLSCYYFLVYHNAMENDYFYIENPKTLFRMNIENIEYNKTYTISIRARNSRSLESDPVEIIMKTPSCLNQHRNLSICAPDAPQNVQVEEIPNSDNLFYYDLVVSWSTPEFLPDYYDIHFVSSSENLTKKFNASGDCTNFTINKVKILHLYYITIRAWSSAGESEPASYGGEVKLVPYKSSNMLLTLLLVGLFVLICFCIAASILISKRINKKRRAQTRNQYFKDLEQKCLSSRNNTMYHYEMKEYLGDEWEIDPKDITYHKILGQGAFGVVRYGLLSKGKSQIEVAVKTLKISPTREELGHFQHELEIMKSVGSHPHLVSLIGVCIKDKYPLLVVEYCSNGDLQNYLKNIWEKIMNSSRSIVHTHTYNNFNRNAREFANKLYDMEPINLSNGELVNSKELLSFARQIAKGMEYLSRLKILHRDLAARNVLICEDKTVKVSDFGLSRDVYQDNVYQKKAGGRLPIRWLAIESLTHQQYTTQSDVWSFGILLWEIVTLGGNPYPGIPTENLLKLLKAGYRMDCPINCKREVYNIMLSSWKTNPKDRMTFTEIREALENLLESETEYLQVDLNTCVEMNTLQINSYKNVPTQKTIFERYVKPIWQ